MLFKESMTIGIASNIIDNNTMFCDQLFRKKWSSKIRKTE